MRTWHLCATQSEHLEGHRHHPNAANGSLGGRKAPEVQLAAAGGVGTQVGQELHVFPGPYEWMKMQRRMVLLGLVNFQQDNYIYVYICQTIVVLFQLPKVCFQLPCSDASAVVSPHLGHLNEVSGRGEK